MSVSTTQGLVTCPACGAAVKAGADWCTLCFADLRPVAPPVLAPRPPVASVSAPPPAFAPATMPAPEPRLSGEAGLPVAEAPGLPGITAVPVPTEATQAQIACRTCGSPMPALADACPTCGSSPFADLAAQSRPSLVLPVVGDVMNYSKNARMAGAAIGSVVIAGILVMIVALVGLAF